MCCIILICGIANAPLMENVKIHSHIVHSAIFSTIVAAHDVESSLHKVLALLQTAA